MTRFLSGLLRVASWLLAAAFILLALFALIMMFPNGLREQLFAEVTTTKPMQTPQTLAVACTGAAIVAAAWFFVLNALRKVVQTVSEGDPFVPENISRLRLIWVVIAAAEIFRMAIHWATTLGDEGGADIDVRIGTWFLVFVIATLSEAFRYGAEMRREQELTI